MSSSYLNKNLKYLRQNSGYSLAVMASKIGDSMTVSTYSSYEDARNSTPKIDTLFKILDIFNERFELDLSIDQIYKVDLETTDIKLQLPAPKTSEDNSDSSLEFYKELLQKNQIIINQQSESIKEMISIIKKLTAK